MKTSKRSRKGLPSPFEVLFYLLAVVAFCVINWRLLNADNTPTPPPAKPFESMVLEAMLDDLGPVEKADTRTGHTATLDFGVSRENLIKLEKWMITPDAFARADTEVELVLEDWMINLSSWGTGSNPRATPARHP